MKNEHYPLTSDDESCFFEFESIGPKGVIQKVILIDYLDFNTWNLAFGDKTETDWTDESVSNNGDMVRVISTVIAAALEFSAKYPTRDISIQPLDERRKKLYNLVFQRNIQDIEEIFYVFGTCEGKYLEYQPNYFFDLFILSRKNH
jgi:hypothetical protein